MAARDLLPPHLMVTAVTTARRRRVKPPQSQSRPHLPDYAPQFFAFHEDFAPELKAMLARLPLAAGQQVLDVACGDGIYSAWIAQLVVPGGSVTAVDASRDWLAIARQTLARHQSSGVILRRADARQLPFENASFDFVWCAQSFYSLPDTSVCLSEMVRVLRPGGTLAILEDDTLHHLLLPWPIDLELAVRAAELAAFRQETATPARYYIGRWLSRLLRRAGLRKVRERALAATRQSPLSSAAATYIADYLQSLATRVRPHLAPEMRKAFERLVDPASRSYFPRQSGFVAICLDRVVWGQKPL